VDAQKSTIEGFSDDVKKQRVSSIFDNRSEEILSDKQHGVERLENIYNFQDEGADPHVEMI